MSHLRDLQLRFQNYLIEDSAEIESDIIGTEHALAEHRLGIYYNAYRIRLIDSLAVDYAALERVIGRDAFEQLALDYLQHYPSSHPSVRWFGAQLPEYLGRHYKGDDAEFLQELASFEWSQSLVFDAADCAEPVQMEEIARLPGEAWASLSFEFIPALRWLDLHWNVAQIENSIDKDDTMPPKQRADYPLRWLLWRRDMKTYWRSLEVHEAWALENATNGADFAQICEGLLEWIDEQQVALCAAGFLKQWVSDQLLQSLDWQR